MRSRPIMYGVALVTAGAAFVFTSTLIHAAIYAPDDSGITAVQAAAGMASAGDSPAAPSGAARASPARTVIMSSPADPARLIIPALGIDANVQDLGINPKGNLGVPNNFTDVGWYALGPVPGQTGNAVIDGHVDNGLGLAGVFKHLDDIQPGDDVYVMSAGGTESHFVVTGLTWYSYTDAASTTDAIFDQRDGGSYLKLITCGGTWVPTDRTYDQRLVVTAVLERS